MARDLGKGRFWGSLTNNPVWQGSARLALLAALLLLIGVSWGRGPLPGVSDPYPLIYTNAATLLFWVVWFMGLVLLAPLTGRAWCSVCPLGYLSERTGRVGFNFQWPIKWVQRFSVLAVFGAGLVAVLLFDAHKSPHLTALTVGGALALAVLSGLWWRRAAFCGFLCPVGAVLNLYGRFSPLKVAPRDPDGCAACATRECVSRKSEWKRWDLGSLVIHKKVYSKGCPVALDPPTMDASQCLTCMECVRNCPNGNMAPFYGLRTSHRPLSGAAILLIVPLAGLVLLTLARTWPQFRDALTPGQGVYNWALWFGLGLPLLLVIAPALFEWLSAKGASASVAEPTGLTPGARSKVEKPGFAKLAGIFAAPFAGPLLGAHLAVALVKLNAKAAYTALLFYDPFGGSTYMAVHVTGMLALPGMLMPMAVLRVLAPALLGLGVVYGFLDARRLWRAPLSTTARGLAVMGLVALSALYGSLLIHWLSAGR